MKILITGICGFAGSTLARSLLEKCEDCSIIGLDSLIRPGSERNRSALKQLGIRVFHADLRIASDLEMLPAVDWVIDAAANPSVQAGVDGRTSSRQLIEHNLSGTINLLEYCRLHRAAFTLLSTSRVYSIPPLASLPTQIKDEAFTPAAAALHVPGISAEGIGEDFSTQPPVSLYGSTKVASEVLALEYGSTFDFPVWINRCGVLAGAGQFGRPDQGIYSFWINRWLRRQPLGYIGFGGKGHQVRDVLHPNDLATLLLLQQARPPSIAGAICNVSGGCNSATSLAQLSRWCTDRFGPHQVNASPETRAFDLPWVVLDATRVCCEWQWQPEFSAHNIFEEIATHAEENPDWLEISAPG